MGLQDQLYKLTDDPSLEATLRSDPVKITVETLHTHFLGPLRVAVEVWRSGLDNDYPTQQVIRKLYEFTLLCGSLRHPFWPTLAETALRARDIVKDPESYPMPSGFKF